MSFDEREGTVRPEKAGKRAEEKGGAEDGKGENSENMCVSGAWRLMPMFWRLMRFRASELAIDWG